MPPRFIDRGLRALSPQADGQGAPDWSTRLFQGIGARQRNTPGQISEFDDRHARDVRSPCPHDKDEEPDWRATAKRPGIGDACLGEISVSGPVQVRKRNLPLNVARALHMKRLNRRHFRALAFDAAVVFCALAWGGAAYAADVRPVVKLAHIAYHATERVVWKVRRA